MNNPTQEEKVYKYLKANKSATGLELLKNCGVICYTKRISNLRKTLPLIGYTIVGEYITVKTRFNGTARVVKYTLTRIKKRK